MRERENCCYDKTYIKVLDWHFCFHSVSVWCIIIKVDGAFSSFFEYISKACDVMQGMSIVLIPHIPSQSVNRNAISQLPVVAETKYSEDYLKLVSIAHPPPQ